MNAATDTIVAIATPPGSGGVGIVRISGPRVPRIVREWIGELSPRQARLVAFRDARGETIDRGLLLYFRAPHSFTGEDVLELHAHGSPVVLAALVRRACELGARPARAGEFSERAFLNGKLDLAQAEAVADLIAAQSEAQARAALRSLQGEFSSRVQALQRALIALRVEVEAAIDFADEPIESLQPPALIRRLRATCSQTDALLAAAQRGARLTDGVHAVIVGRPNVGKSSLLNALAGGDRAIVTDIPGTTRDVLRESIVIDGVALTLADTAGLRESGDVVESEGIRRARAELGRADAALLVVERDEEAADATLLSGLPGTATRIVIINKIDLAGVPATRREHEGQVSIALSAKTGSGIELLREELKRLATGGEAEGAFSARARHVQALQRARERLAAAIATLEAAPAVELAAEELRAAHRALGEITGEFTSEDLLGAIFSTFCIGK